MNKTEWNEFVRANEARALTLTLADRNLIADADQHIDWLESRKRFSEEQIEALRLQLARAHEALGALIAASGAALDALNELIGAEYDVMGEQWRLTEAVKAARAVLQEKTQ